MRIRILLPDEDLLYIKNFLQKTAGASATMRLCCKKAVDEYVKQIHPMYPHLGLRTGLDRIERFLIIYFANLCDRPLHFHIDIWSQVAIHDRVSRGAVNMPSINYFKRLEKEYFIKRVALADRIQEMLNIAAKALLVKAGGVDSVQAD